MTDPTGLQHLRARYYNPSLGIFTQQDPVQGIVGGSASMYWNPYGYVGGNPVNYTDPSGDMLDHMLPSLRLKLLFTIHSALFTKKDHLVHTTRRIHATLIKIGTNFSNF